MRVLHHQARPQRVRRAQPPATPADDLPQRCLHVGLIEAVLAGVQVPADLVRRVYAFFHNKRVGLVIILVLGLLTLLGVLFPQAPDTVRGDPQAWASWLDQVRPRFRGWTDPLALLPAGSFGGDDSTPPLQHNLAFRNLARGSLVRLATAQQMVTRLKNAGVAVTPLTKAQVLGGKNGAKLDHLTAAHRPELHVVIGDGGDEVRPDDDHAERLRADVDDPHDPSRAVPGPQRAVR